jgi:imidazolonepropionase-like amidohydrolase
MRILIACVLFLAAVGQAQVAVRGDKVYTMADAPINDGVVLMRGSKVERVGPAAQVAIPAGYRTLHAQVVTPGLIDAHSVLGLSGYLNVPQDQDQVERSAPMQPELRAIDAYDAREPMIGYVRSYGVTTVHTGHGPGILMSGQTMIVKTIGSTVEEAVITPLSMIAVTLGDGAREQGGKSPGSRSKAAAMLRTELIKAQEYSRKAEKKDASTPRDLRLEALTRLIKREIPLLITAHRSQDILTAIRIGKEFNLRIVLDGASEAYLITGQIKASGYPVIVHPTMQRTSGETANGSFENAAKLKAAGISFAIQSGYESYVPKQRVILFEAAMAAANGLTFEEALGSITIGAARILGIEGRAGSLEPGKDGDVALYDGDPFEYTTHCTGVVINGEVVSEAKR